MLKYSVGIPEGEREMMVEGDEKKEKKKQKDEGISGMFVITRAGLLVEVNCRFAISLWSWEN